MKPKTFGCYNRSMDAAMIKKPTADLAEEHGGITLMLKIMEKAAKRLRSGEVKKEHLDKIVEFLRNFADKCHHGKEEGILFPEMSKKPSNRKPINELLGEHMAGRDLIRGMAESLKNYHKGNPDAIHIAVNMEEYIGLLTEHIKKENLVLFPKADKQLSQKLQEEMEEKFEEFEKTVIGEGVHEKYHGWLKELSKIYLAR